MPIQISKIRFWCEQHKTALMNCGNGRVFSPTHTCIEEVEGTDPLELRKDSEGWLHLDTSELTCPHRYKLILEGKDTDENHCCQDWVIQAE